MLLKNYLDRENLEQEPTRNGYGRGLVEAGGADEDVVVLCADLTESTRSHWFREEFPERFFEIGVAEQNMMGIAAGLGLSGKAVFVSSYAVFSPGRNWDQLRVSVCYSRANVKVAGAHAGLSVGPDGATHQALEDIAAVRVLPNIVVLYPADAKQAQKATVEAAKHEGPVYIRLSRAASPVFTKKDADFKVGGADVLVEGDDLTVIAAGPLTYEALRAAENLKDKYSIEVINAYSIKPLDEETIVQSAEKTSRVVTVDEHQVSGGLGSAVAELLSEKHPVPIKRIGVEDRFGESGDPYELWEEFGLDEKGLEESFKKVLEGE